MAKTKRHVIQIRVDLVDLAKSNINMVIQHYSATGDTYDFKSQWPRQDLTKNVVKTALRLSRVSQELIVFLASEQRKTFKEVVNDALAFAHEHMFFHGPEVEGQFQ